MCLDIFKNHKSFVTFLLLPTPHFHNIFLISSFLFRSPLYFLNNWAFSLLSSNFEFFLFTSALLLLTFSHSLSLFLSHTPTHTDYHFLSPFNSVSLKWFFFFPFPSANSLYISNPCFLCSSNIHYFCGSLFLSGFFKFFKSHRSPSYHFNFFTYMFHETSLSKYWTTKAFSRTKNTHLNPELKNGLQLTDFVTL